MKKSLALILALIMFTALSIPVFAATGGFVSSPSGNPAPELVDFSNSDENCSALLKVTPYSQRDTLDSATRAKLEKAYSDILNTSNIATLNAELAKLAGKLNIPQKDLAVSDMFDISYYACDGHEGHGHFDIKLKAETLDNFVALLYLNGESWELIEDAKVENENHLTFTVKELSPFAIVVNTNPGEEIPPTSDAFPWIPIVVLTVSVVAVVFILVKTRKRS